MEKEKEVENPCQCEHVRHFNEERHVTHSYMSVPAVGKFKTLYGPYNLCQRCKDICHKNYAYLEA